MNEILRAYQGDENYVFVSYSHKDKDEVYPIIRTMQENGYNVWFDEGIAPSSEWDEYIAKHTDGANFFIAMASPEYLASPFCIKELKFACNYLHKKILLIYLEEVELSLGLQLTTTDLQAIKKYEISDTSYFYAKLFSTEALDSCKSQNIRFYSGDTADKTDDAFEIENGVLKKYHGESDIVVIPDGITSIGDFAFQNCESLTAVKIADSVTSIGNFAFWGCGALASVYIPDGLTSIGDGAFQTCDALAAIDIPESVIHMGRCAFNTNTRTGTPSPVSEPMNQTWIEEHEDIQEHTADDEPAVPEPSCKTASPITDFEIKNYILKKYLGNSETVVIPEGVVMCIGDKAFLECKSLTSIYIPNGVTSIRDNAFKRCYSLKSIHIPDSVTYIGSEAFWDCEALTSIKIPDSVTHIGYQAFLLCNSLKSVKIPKSVTHIGKDAFPSNTKIIRVSTAVPEQPCKPVSPITDFEIKNYILKKYLGNSETVVIPEKVVTCIGDKAFWECKSLTSIYIPNGVTSIRDNAFERCDSLKSIYIPDSVTYIGSEAFSRCNALTSIKIPDGVTCIGNEAFWGCDSLKSIKIPNGVTSIGDEAFAWCESLKSVKISKSVTYIGENAFPPATKIIRVSATP